MPFNARNAARQSLANKMANASMTDRSDQSEKANGRHVLDVGLSFDPDQASKTCKTYRYPKNCTASHSEASFGI